MNWWSCQTWRECAGQSCMWWWNPCLQTCWGRTADTHNRISYITFLFLFVLPLPLCVSLFLTFSLSTSVPYQRCGVIRQGARRVRELGKAGVGLLHGLDPRHQQLRHLFLWDLQRTHTESYGVNNIDSVRKYNVSACESEWDVQMWFLPSYGTSSFRWPGGTWTELRGLSCRAETRETNIILQRQYNKQFSYYCHR